VLDSKPGLFNPSNNLGRLEAPKFPATPQPLVTLSSSPKQGDQIRPSYSSCVSLTARTGDLGALEQEFIWRTRNSKVWKRETVAKMVVLAASICTRGGKRESQLLLCSNHTQALTPFSLSLSAIISRQFRDMSRSRVEALLSSFPKLLSSNSQHTSVETESVRYVYQPLEDLYMILITNKNSNILQDIDTLHLFTRIVTDICSSSGASASAAAAAAAAAASGQYGTYGMYAGLGGGLMYGAGKVDERTVLRLSFELLGAFDEVIAMGYRENVNLMQIKNILEMESHEEKIQDIIERVSRALLFLSQGFQAELKLFPLAF
jgi:hypothetical protein